LKDDQIDTTLNPIRFPIERDLVDEINDRQENNTRTYYSAPTSSCNQTHNTTTTTTTDIHHGTCPTMTRRGTTHNLLTSARSFLSYSHHKLLTTLDSTTTSRHAAREPSHLLLKAVLIQNAMDDVDGLVRTLQSDVKKEEQKLKTPVPRRSSLGQESWFEVIREEDEEMEEDEDESVHVPAVVVAAAAADADSHAEGEWFEQHWRELQEDESDQSSTDEWDSGTEVQVVAVTDDLDAEDLDDDLDMFPPLPAAVVQLPPVDGSSRDAIYHSMPSSPVLRPTVIYDKMYVPPSQHEESVAIVTPVSRLSPPPSSPSPSPSPTIERVEHVVAVAVTTVSDQQHDFIDEADDYTDSDSDVDSEGPITPQQDVIDDFGSCSLGAEVSSSTACSNQTQKDAQGSANDGRKTVGGAEGMGVGGCENCPGCRGEAFVVDEDEVYF
jgi:hypothetical protein